MARNASYYVLLIICYLSLVVPSFAKIHSGSKAPGFILADINGKKVSLTGILADNKPVIISFFATWCKPCLKEIPHLEKLQNESDVRVYLINIDNISTEKVSGFLKEKNIKLRVLLDPEARITGDAYEVLKGGLASIPKLFLFSPTGIIKFVSEGYDNEIEQKLTNEIVKIEREQKNKPRELAIFFTNSTNGYFESCDCPTHPYGGLVRRATYLKQQRKKHPNNLVLDSGDLFPPYVPETMAEYILKIYRLLEYDAVGIGDQEFSCKNFVKNIESSKVPFLSSNINCCEGNMCRFITPHEKVINKQNLKIKILSVIHPDVFILYPEKIKRGLNILPVEDILENKKGNCDFLILISHSGFDTDKEIAKNHDNIDLIIGGHSQTLLTKPYKVKNTLIVQAGQDAQNVGKLILKFDENKKIFDYDYEVFPLTKDIPDDPQIRALIKEYRKKITKKK
ncbi:MAG: redoxin domain-containing protein [Elusimicrobia bacterium]|nr:redoxin domain-containing protein [Elusimicrobiota bacterium]